MPKRQARLCEAAGFIPAMPPPFHSDGYVEIRDRLKDVIISGGENISSVEVEATLLRHPGVQEAAIVGLPHERWGEAPHAFVVRKDGTACTQDELIAFVRDRLAHFKA